MNVQKLKIASLSLVLCGLTTPVIAQSADQMFVKEAASGGMTEVKLGQVAQRNGSKDSVKNFGKMMEMDHTNAGNQLKEIAARNKISVPATMSKSDESTYEKLSKLSGPDFDQAYANGMIMDHQKTIALFKKEASDGQNADMKRFAADTLPTLQEHLKQAQIMQKDTATR